MGIDVNYECCKYCSNNPTNNPNAGPCCCSLPYMSNTVAGTPTTQYSFSTTTVYEGYVPKFTNTTQG